jgi:hypothetical protein
MIEAQDSAADHAYACEAARKSRTIESHDVLWAARVAYEVNRAYCEAIGENTQLKWEDAPNWLRASLIDGVRFIIENPKATARDQHNNWLRVKHADGWTWGPCKNVDLKQHPCMRDYDELPQVQRVKDHLFRAVVKSTLAL